MKNRYIILSCLLSMVIYSCSDKDALEIENNAKSQVLFSVDDFIPESQTRTNCDPSNNYKITWASGDAIGIFPREGDQEPFIIPSEQVGQSKASFDGGYWALKDGKSYNAYYPFSRENYASSDMKTKIAVSYLGQSQTGNECNVGAYDYTYSDWTTSVGGAGVSFSFHHIGSFLVLTLPIPANATYTTLTLNAGNAVIPTSGTYDLTLTKPAFVVKTKASSLSMQLNDFTGVAGENATFYMMVPPINLSAETLTVTLLTGSSSCTYSIESKNILAANLYELEGTPISSTVTGTIDEWLPSFPKMHNGHEYVDLGLPSGLLWATCNVGASKTEDCGDYYAWGETTTKTYYDWSSNKYCTGTYQVTKYNTKSFYGTVDDKTVLDPEDDAAFVNWGGSWRMPTKEELDELNNTDNCTWTWTTQNDVDGYKVTSKRNNKSIFLPAAGVYSGSGVSFAGSMGYYWSSSLHTSPPAAYSLYFDSSDIEVYESGRGGGLSVRPVCVLE